jgi:hypothetical protein
VNEFVRENGELVVRSEYNTRSRIIISFSPLRMTRRSKLLASKEILSETYNIILPIILTNLALMDQLWSRYCLLGVVLNSDNDT